MITPRHSVLFVAAALAAMLLGVPAAGAGSGDVQAVRSAAVSYWAAVSAGSPTACQMMTPRAQRMFAEVSSGLLQLQKKLDCPAAVKAIAKKNESLVGSHGAYVRMNNLTLRALARGKVTVKGTHANVDYSYVDGPVSSSSNLLFALVHGSWLADG